jgi:hypothetical protein
MPSSLPKYSGLISEHQLSILDEFIVLHDGISKARVLGRLLEAWQDAGKPILGDRDTTLLDLALQFEQLDLDALVAQKVREYLDIHLDSLVNNLVENKLRPILNIDHRETPIDNNLVNNELATNDWEDDESLAEGNIADKGESKVVTDKDEREVLSLPARGKQLGDKEKEQSELVSNKDINQDKNLTEDNIHKDITQVNELGEQDISKDINQVDNVSDEDIGKVDQLKEKDKNKDNNQADNLTEDDINKDITPVDELGEQDINKDINQVNNLSDEDISKVDQLKEKDKDKDNNQDNNLTEDNINKGITPVDDVREEDSNKDNNQVKNLNCEDISSSEESHNLVNNKVSNKVSENDEAKQEVKDSSMSTITEENPASQLVITLDKSQVKNPPDVSHIPAKFLALPLGKVETKKLAEAFGFKSSSRVTDLGSGKNTTLPFPEFWDYMEVKPTTKTNKNGKEVNFYEWKKVK